MNLESPEFTALIHQSAELRGAGDFEGAIELIESQLAKMEPDCLLNAYLEIFFAASEVGAIERATEYAQKLAAIDPQIPSVKQWLQNV